MKSSEAHPESVNGRLATYLNEQKESIIGEWLVRVRGDIKIRTDTLSTEALKNHLPVLFDDLTQTLRRYGSETVAEQSVKDAEEHGAMRWRQGYDIAEVLRELKHLRVVIIYSLCMFEELNPDYGMAARLFVTVSLHRFLDEMAIDATEQFVRADSGDDLSAPVPAVQSRSMDAVSDA